MNQNTLFVYKKKTPIKQKGSIFLFKAKKKQKSTPLTRFRPTPLARLKKKSD